MRAIKVLVIVMGVLIIGGVVLLGFVLSDRMGKKTLAPKEDILLLPQSAHIKSFEMQEGTLILRLSFPENHHEEIWLIQGKKGGDVKKIITQ